MSEHTTGYRLYAADVWTHDRLQAVRSRRLNTRQATGCTQLTSEHTTGYRLYAADVWTHDRLQAVRSRCLNTRQATGCTQPTSEHTTGYRLYAADVWTHDRLQAVRSQRLNTRQATGCTQPASEHTTGYRLYAADVWTHDRLQAVHNSYVTFIMTAARHNIEYIIFNALVATGTRRYTRQHTINFLNTFRRQPPVDVAAPPPVAPPTRSWTHLSSRRFSLNSHRRPARVVQ